MRLFLFRSAKYNFHKAIFLLLKLTCFIGLAFVFSYKLVREISLEKFKYSMENALLPLAQGEKFKRRCHWQWRAAVSCQRQLSHVRNWNCISRALRLLMMITLCTHACTRHSVVHGTLCLATPFTVVRFIKYKATFLGLYACENADHCDHGDKGHLKIHWCHKTFAVEYHINSWLLYSRQR
jgi:hypothetical protein